MLYITYLLKSQEKKVGKSMGDRYHFVVDGFEGPLDLLLHLVNKLEIDIYDIPVSEITEQYLSYIRTMQIIELNVASEYLVMAATLLAIKSEMLLPKKEITEYEDDYLEDPRDDLIRRLIEYRKYKEAAHRLQEQEFAENQIYTRTPKEFETELDKPPVVKGDVTIYDMIGALQHVFKRKQWKKPLETRVSRVDISIDEKKIEIINIISRAKQGVYFDELFTVPQRSHIVTTFLALLQLMKSNKLICEQENHFDPIYVYLMEE